MWRCIATSRCVVLGVLLATAASTVWSADVYVRFRVIEPEGEQFRVIAGGYIHEPNWYLPSQTVEVVGKQWSGWLDLTKWPLHGRLSRSGGVAEWPAMKLTVRRLGKGEPVAGCVLEVQLADRPDENSVVISFRERSDSDTIGFLLPHPLREHKDQFETGSQMAARHLAWAKQAVGARRAAAGLPPLQLGQKEHRLKQFDLITSLWGPYDPGLARRWVEALRLLGFNVIGGVGPEILHDYNLRTYTATWHLRPDPDESLSAWQKGDGARIAKELAKPAGTSTYHFLAHYVICDEIQTLDFRRVDPEKLNRWFRDYLRSKGETDATLGQPIDKVAYPAAAMFEKTLPRDADLPTRKLMYYAGKFGQWWSVKQLRQTSDLLRQSLAGAPQRVKTETLPSDHCFFNAWGPPHTAMGYRGLDFFEIGTQQAVDVISAEDWLGLNHMYGPSYTWTGQHALGYLCAIYRSGIGDRPVELRALITPSDDGYLRLKAYAALAQGCKSFFFWTFGPTYIGTENYWSDLRSQYDGLAKLVHALEQSESVLISARPSRDPVALLYSVSHDMWHTDDPASFVENRLTWAALRHLSVQPDLLREEDVEAGRLSSYRVLYVTGQCLTRKAAAEIDRWVREGGVVYLSAGAATRDEFFQPHLAPFAAAVWPDDAARQMTKQQGHAYNERVDLPRIKPLAKVRVTLDGQTAELPAIGCRLDLREQIGPGQFGTFDDGRPAAAHVSHGKGQVIAVGFLPGLAYSPYKVNQTTLDEVWPPQPRMLFALPLRAALGDRRVLQLSEPVVEGSLLVGPAGAAVVLINHTYKPIGKLQVRIGVPLEFSKAISTEGVAVQVARTNEGTTLELPLEWTDIVLLRK